MKLLVLSEGDLSVELRDLTSDKEIILKRFDDLAEVDWGRFDMILFVSEPDEEIRSFVRSRAHDTPVAVFSYEKEDTSSSKQTRAPHMVLVVDLKDNELIYANEAVKDILGYRPEELIGKKFFELMNGDESKKTNDFMKEHIKEGRQEGTFTDRIITADARVKLIENRFKVLTDLNGTPDNLLILAWDKDRKRDDVSRVSREEYGTIFENTGTALALVEEDGTISKVNQRFTELSGYSKEEVEGKANWTEFVGPEDLKRMQEYHNARREDPDLVPKEYDFNFHDRDGRRRIIHLNINMIPNSTRSVASMIDVTQNKQVEDISRGLMESKQVGMIVVQEGTIVKLNPCFARLLRSSQEKLLGRDPLSFVPDEEKLDTVAKSREMIWGKRKEPYEHRFARDDGSEGWVLEQVTPIIFEGKDAVLITFIDITSEKEKEEELQRRERLYRTLIETANSGIVITDENDEFVFVNQAFLDMLNCDEDRIIGRSVSSIATEEGMNAISEANERRKVGSSDYYETEFLTRDGNKISVLVSASPLWDNDQRYTGSVAVINDITEQKKMEEREEFLHSLLRHDLKNKAQITLGYLEILKDEIQDEEDLGFIDRSIESCYDSMDLIMKVKKLLETEKSTDSYPVDLIEHVNAAIEEHMVLADEKGYDIDMTEIDGKVIGGPLLEELFSNIIGNALIHSNGEKILIRSEDRGDSMLVTIEDDGIGIPSDKRDKIFERGYKGPGSKGTGLGTFIVKRIADLYGGKVEIDDSELGGARFDVYLKKA